MSHERIQDFEHDGYRAVILRMTGYSRHLCGYVGLPPGHPLDGVDYSDKAACLDSLVSDETPIGKRGVLPLLCRTLDDDGGTTPDVAFDVHGSITYAGRSEGARPYPQKESDGRWYYGFDCAHAGDSPEVQDEPYVRQEILRLIDQLKAVQANTPQEGDR